MSDDSSYCANRGIITTLRNEQLGIEFVREGFDNFLKSNLINMLKTRRNAINNSGYKDNKMNTESSLKPVIDVYNFADDDIIDILNYYGIPSDFYLMILDRNLQLNSLITQPVILLNVSLKNINNPTGTGHWVVLYRIADFPDCEFLQDIETSSGAHYNSMRARVGVGVGTDATANLTLNSFPLPGYTIYYPRFKGDCGPDTVRMIMLLYCCWLSPPAAAATPINIRTKDQDLVSALRTIESPIAASEQATSAVYDSVRRSLEETDTRLTDAAGNVVGEIITEIRRSSRIRGIAEAEAVAAAAALVALENLADAREEDLINIAVVLLNSDMPSSGASAGSQLSQQLLNIAQSSGILPPANNMRAGPYNAEIKNILDSLGVENKDLRMRDVYTATKGAKEISEPRQFTDVWGTHIADYVKQNGFCYLSGEDFVPSDYPEMDHVKFATSAFMGCIHYRKLTNKDFCGISVYDLWHAFINTPSGINLLWKLYQALNQGTRYRGVRVYSEDAVNTCYTNVFSAFRNFIKDKCKTRTIEKNTFNYSTSMLKYWLAEFAYALHIFNQAKGQLNLNATGNIEKMNKDVKQRIKNPKRDPKTLQELKNHRGGRFTSNNKFIAGRVGHLEQIAKDFTETGYGCVSNLTTDQLANPELVSMVFLMKRLRDILLYSRIQNNKARVAASDINSAATMEVERSDEDILKELQTELEQLQNKLRTDTNEVHPSRQRIKLLYEIKELESRIAERNSQKEVDNGLFGRATEKQREQIIKLSSSIQTNQEVVPVYDTPPHSPPRWGPPLADPTRVLETSENVRGRTMETQSGPPTMRDRSSRSRDNVVVDGSSGVVSNSRRLGAVETLRSSAATSRSSAATSRSSLVDTLRRRVKSIEEKDSKKGGTIKNKRRTQKQITSRRRKTTKRLMSRRKRYTRKQKK
jgi:hypothetical protein